MTADEVDVPTGPFVTYGGFVGGLVAPRTGTARGHSIGIRIFFAHVLVAFALLVFVTRWPAAVTVVGNGLILLGAAAGYRYGENCKARHRQYMNRLAEEFEGEFHEL